MPTRSTSSARSLPVRSSIWQRLRRGWLPLSLLGLLLAGGARADLPSAAHIWVLAVNGGLTIGDANTLRFMAQGPVAGALAVSGNRKRVFGLDNATGRLFEIHTKTLAVTPLLELKEVQSGLCANPDGSRILIYSNSKKTLRLLDTVSKAVQPVASDVMRVKSCHFSLDGQTAYVLPTVADDLLTVDIKSGKVAGKLSIATPPSRVQDFAIHPNPAKKLALVADGTRVLFLDTTTHKPQGPDLSLGAPVRSIAFHPNGNLFFALGDDKIYFVDLQTRKIQKSIELAPGGTFRVLAVDGQGKRLYASGNHEINDGLGAVINGQGKEFVLIDVDTGKKTYQHYSPVESVQYLVSP